MILNRKFVVACFSELLTIDTLDLSIYEYIHTHVTVLPIFVHNFFTLEDFLTRNGSEKRDPASL